MSCESTESKMPGHVEGLDGRKMTNLVLCRKPTGKMEKNSPDCITDSLVKMDLNREITRGIF